MAKKKETKKKGRYYATGLTDGLSELESYSDLAVLTLKETGLSASKGDIKVQEESIKKVPKKRSKSSENRPNKRRKFDDVR